MQLQSIENKFPCEGRLPTPLTECSMIGLLAKYIYNSYSKNIRLNINKIKIYSYRFYLNRIAS